MVAEHLHHLLRFVPGRSRPLSTEVRRVRFFADSAVQQHRGHRSPHRRRPRIRCRRQPADGLRSTASSMIFARGPQRFALADVAHEALQHTHSLTGVGHFRNGTAHRRSVFLRWPCGERAVVDCAGDGYESPRWDVAVTLCRREVIHHVQQRFCRLRDSEESSIPRTSALSFSPSTCA